MANIPLESITFPGLSDKYTIPQIDTTLAVSGKAADAKATGDRFDAVEADLTDVESALETKANIDGSYDTMTVGNAKQLVGTVGVEDKVPYLFRTSGGSADIGDREYDEIVGGTVAWNQLVPNANKSFTNESTDSKTYVSFIWRQFGDNYTQLINLAVSSNGRYEFIKSASFTGTTQILHSGSSRNIDFIQAGTVSVVSGHKYLLSIKFTGTDPTTVGGVDSDDLQITDLTQMFGTTIADYIYSLEQANTGAGVAWFRKLFPKAYYPYDAGTLKSVEGVSAHVMTGFNQWDEEWEVGKLDPADGRPISSSENIRSKNFIPVLPNTTYFWRASVNNVSIFYDAEKNYITTGYNNGNTTFQTPTECRYIKFYVAASYGTTYNHDICINLHWDGERDGEYEPYVTYSYPLDDSLTLRGIPKLDANNGLYYDGDTYEADGTVTRKYGIVDLGTLTWTKDSSYTYTRFAAEGQITDKWKPNGVDDRADGLLCQKYEANVAAISGTVDKCISGYKNTTSIYITDSSYTDAAAFKTAMSGVYLVYELATPTTETADPFQSPQIVDDFGTEEYVSTSIVPVGHNTKYTNNLRAKLEMAPDSPGDGNGDYIVRQTNGVNEYVAIGSTATIQSILDRLTALENA